MTREIRAWIRRLIRNLPSKSTMSTCFNSLILSFLGSTSNIGIIHVFHFRFFLTDFWEPSRASGKRINNGTINGEVGYMQLFWAGQDKKWGGGLYICNQLSSPYVWLWLDCMYPIISKIYIMKYLNHKPTHVH